MLVGVEAGQDRMAGCTVALPGAVRTPARVWNNTDSSRRVRGRFPWFFIVIKSVHTHIIIIVMLALVRSEGGLLTCIAQWLPCRNRVLLAQVHSAFAAAVQPLVMAGDPMRHRCDHVVYHVGHPEGLPRCGCGTVFVSDSVCGSPLHPLHRVSDLTVDWEVDTQHERDYLDDLLRRMPDTGPRRLSALRLWLTGVHRPLLHDWTRFLRWALLTVDDWLDVRVPRWAHPPHGAYTGLLPALADLAASATHWPRSGLAVSGDVRLVRRLLRRMALGPALRLPETLELQMRTDLFDRPAPTPPPAFATLLGLVGRGVRRIHVHLPWSQSPAIREVGDCLHEWTVGAVDTLTRELHCRLRCRYACACAGHGQPAGVEVSLWTTEPAEEERHRVGLGRLVASLSAETRLALVRVVVEHEFVHRRYPCVCHIRHQPPRYLDEVWAAMRAHGGIERLRWCDRVDHATVWVPDLCR